MMGTKLSLLLCCLFYFTKADFMFDTLRFTCTRYPNPITVQPWFKFDNGIVTGRLDNYDNLEMRGLMINDFEWEVFYKHTGTGYTAAVQFNFIAM